MGGTMTGLDRYKLTMLAKEHKIHLPHYDFFITMYETALLEQQKKALEKSK